MMNQKRANDECSQSTCWRIIQRILSQPAIVYILLYNYYYKIFLQVKKPFSTSFGPTFSVCSFRCFPAFSWFIYGFLLIDFSLLFLSAILPVDKHGEQSENKSVT